MGSVLQFLWEQKVQPLFVVPDRYPRPYWWPILQSERSLEMARQGDVDLLLCPAKDGLVDYCAIP